MTSFYTEKCYRLVSARNVCDISVSTLQLQVVADTFEALVGITKLQKRVITSAE